MKILSFLTLFCLSCMIAYGQTNESKMAFNNGLKHYRLKEYQEAIPYLETAVEKSPDFMEAYQMMAHCYDGLDNIDKAIENYKLVLSINPNLEKPLYNLGLLYISKKDYEQAETYLQKAVSISPNYVAAKTKLEKLQKMNTSKELDTTIAEPEDFIPPSFDDAIPTKIAEKNEVKTEAHLPEKEEVKLSKKELRKQRKANENQKKAARKKRKKAA